MRPPFWRNNCRIFFSSSGFLLYLYSDKYGVKFQTHQKKISFFPVSPSTLTPPSARKFSGKKWKTFKIHLLTLLRPNKCCFYTRHGSFFSWSLECNFSQATLFSCRPSKIMSSAGFVSPLKCHLYRKTNQHIWAAFFLLFGSLVGCRNLTFSFCEIL